MVNRNAGKSYKTWVVLLVGLMCLSLTLSSCANIRQKFTRKKNKDKETNVEVPILEPMEYPDKVYTVTELYPRAFSIWGAWSKEISSSLQEKANNKRMLYLIDKSLEQLEQMRKFIKEEKREALTKAIHKLEKMRGAFASHVLLQDMSSLRNDYSSIERVIRKNYNYKDIQQYLRE